MKLLYLDCETTGLDPVKNGVIQVAGIVEIDGVVVREFDIKCQPRKGDMLDPKALQVNGVSAAQLKERTLPDVAYQEFKQMCDQHVNRFDKTDKFFMVGQNPRFDYDFMTQWFKKAGDQYFYSYVDYHLLDIIGITALYQMAGHINVPNMKLATVCATLGIPLDAHDALKDIRATREVFQRYIAMAKGDFLALNPKAKLPAA